MDEPVDRAGMWQVAQPITAEMFRAASERMLREHFQPAQIIVDPLTYDRIERAARVITIFGGNPWNLERNRVDFDLLVAPRLTLALRRLKRYRRDLRWWLQDLEEDPNSCYSTSMIRLRSWRRRPRRASRRLRSGR